MESPSLYSDTLNEQDDLVYPCKGCGEILEEGKAFELAGNRWHIDCFRCNTCGTLLDSDANLLLLGDGSLICNNCTYSCNACGNKIEDLAILTGDQAFCAHCFRCRNCKKKIDNLRYARTSQGIFCMACHESVMARRRKRAKGSSRAAHTAATNSGPGEKALPQLPPGAASTAAGFASPGSDDAPVELFAENSVPRSPPETLISQPRARREPSSQNTGRDQSPMSDVLAKDETTLPASTYGDSRPSNVSDETDDGEERGFLPMAFDPTPIAPPNPVTRKQVPRKADNSPAIAAENNPPKDYFNKTSSRSTRDHVKDLLRDGPVDSSRATSFDSERDSDRRFSQIKTSPAIAGQETGRNKRLDASEASTSNAGSSQNIPSTDKSKALSEAILSTPKETTLLQDSLVDRIPTSMPRSDSKAEARSSLIAPLVEFEAIKSSESRSAASPTSLDSPDSAINPFDDPMNRNRSGAPSPLPPPRSIDGSIHEEPRSTPITKNRFPEQEAPATLSHKTTGHKRRTSAASVQSSLTDAVLNAGRHSLDGPPPRAPGRVLPVGRSSTVNDLVTSRTPSGPPLSMPSHQKHDSISTLQSSDGTRSPAHRSVGSLPQQALDGPFSMEEEMARILRGDNYVNKRDSQLTENANSNNVLRRVSNVVKHGRSFSDRGLHSSGKSQSTPDAASMEISAPVLDPSSPVTGTQVSIDQLRAQLKRANQRITELEAEKSGLQDKVDSSAEITAASNELREKRNTMIVLDTQREMIVAELESMTAQLKRAKDGGKPLDLQVLKTDISRDFASALQKVKDNMARQIEDLMHKRNELTDEIGTLIQMKDKGFQEYESLSAKNAQLVELNSQMVQNIQGIYKSNANGKSNGGSGAITLTTNGLGIHSAGLRTDGSGPLTEETEAEPAAIIGGGPQMVSIRKGQPKKFNWRKGGEKMAKNVTKGIKGAFVGEKPTPTTPFGEIGLPYNFTQVATGNDQHGNLNGRGPTDPRAGGGFGFFNQKNNNQKPLPMGMVARNGSSSNLQAAAEASVLFGSELEARCDHEQRMIPSVVSRCIEEVEARGMDVEGIYRKSGGSGQVKSVQQGFEKDGKHDISDPDLDIHAVTSALKQYFRKLPTPLITYDAYETLLVAAQTSDKEKQIVGLQAVVGELPDSHRNCLEYLIQHLSRVIAHEGQNLMTSLNISVVFAPTIMRPLSIEREMSDMQIQRSAVQALLEHHQAVFNSAEWDRS